MGGEVKNLRASAYRTFLRAKRILYHLDSKDFQIAWENTVDRSAAEKLIKAQDEAGLKTWIESHLPLADLSLRKLRKRAQVEQVPNYSRLSRNQLLTALGD